MTAIDYPPMQDPATFNLDAIKAKIQEMTGSPRGAIEVDKATTLENPIEDGRGHIFVV